MGQDDCRRGAQRHRSSLRGLPGDVKYAKRFNTQSGSLKTRIIAFKLGLATLLPLAMLIILAVLAVADKRTDLMNEHKLKTRRLVESAYGVLTHFHGLEKQRKLSAEDAR